MKELPKATVTFSWEEKTETEFSSKEIAPGIWETTFQAKFSAAQGLIMDCIFNRNLN